MKVNEYVSNAQRELTEKLAAGKAEDLLVFYTNNTTNDYAATAALNAMVKKGMCDENFKLFPDWKQRVGLDENWDMAAYLAHGN